MKIWPDKIADRKKMAYQNSGVADGRSGAWVTTAGVGKYYGTAMKAAVGKIRGDTVGFRPVSHKQLGTPPKSVV